MSDLIDQRPVGSTADYFEENIISIDTSPEIDIQNDEVFNSISDVPLWNISINTNNYSPNKTIMGKISYKDNIYFTENETLNICGYGDTIFEAIIDFRSHVIYFFKYYGKNDNKKFTKNALRLKKIYSDLLSRE